MDILGIAGLVKSVIDKVLDNKNESKSAKAKIDELVTTGELELLAKQVEANIEASKSDSFFVAGARPAALWVCVIIFGYHYLLYPIIITASALAGFDVSILPQFDLQAIMWVLGGLLGIGGYRTVEKLRNVARSKI